MRMATTTATGVVHDVLGARPRPGSWRGLQPRGLRVAGAAAFVPLSPLDARFRACAVVVAAAGGQRRLLLDVDALLLVGPVAVADRRSIPLVRLAAAAAGGAVAGPPRRAESLQRRAWGGRRRNRRVVARAVAAGAGGLAAGRAGVELRNAPVFHAGLGGVQALLEQSDGMLQDILLVLLPHLDAPELLLQLLAVPPGYRVRLPDAQGGELLHQGL
mmetsp:Transcript_103007/g.295602  ORF Transcript_103007/g.295602 Transcript_103007/m.295602 type:complete len:216 (+) Transcript_103007:301-948(+)